MTTNQYKRRAIEALGEDYMRHLSAMTAERLHDKSDIAAELAFRDVQIRELREVLSWLAEGARAALERATR